MLGSNVNRMVPLAGSRLSALGSRLSAFGSRRSRLWPFDVSAFGVSENMQGVMKAESEEPARITKPESRKS